MIQIDRYTVSARFLPAAVIAAPLALAVYTWAPFDVGLARGTAVIFVLTAVAYVLSHPTRDVGRKLEERLWPAWGGAPSITFLRHRDTTIDPITKERFHTSLVALGAVSSLPTKEAELCEPGEADHAYAAACNWLRSRTRERKLFPLVFEENVNYGYLRNLLACRTWGFTACIVGLISCVIAIWYGRQATVETAVTILVLLYLGFSVTEEALRRQANTYARRLLESIDTLSNRKAPVIPPKKASA